MVSWKTRCFPKKSSTFLTLQFSHHLFSCEGAYSQGEEHVLQAVQKAHEIQGYSIQEGQGL